MIPEFLVSYHARVLRLTPEICLKLLFMQFYSNHESFILSRIHIQLLLQSICCYRVPFCSPRDACWTEKSGHIMIVRPTVYLKKNKKEVSQLNLCVQYIS